MTLTGFPRIVQKHLDEAQSIREGLAHEGPQLVRRICSRPGCSLRKLAKQSGLSPTYLSQIENRKAICSPGAFVTLSEIDTANARAFAHKSKEPHA
jgi:AraC-like DNA-binding protein